MKRDLYLATLTYTVNYICHFFIGSNVNFFLPSLCIFLRPKFQMKEKSRIFQTGYCVKNPEKQKQKTKQNKTSIIQIDCMLKPPDCMLK